MIRIRVEMCPRGDETDEKVYEIGRAYVANVGGDALRGDYEVAVCRRGSTAVPSPIDPSGPKATRSGKVFAYPRLAYNQWRLVIRALLCCFGEEKHVAATGKSLLVDETALLTDASDEQAEMLGREICGGNWPAEKASPGPEGDTMREFGEQIRAEQTKIGREAWIRGARPREWSRGR